MDALIDGFMEGLASAVGESLGILITCLGYLLGVYVFWALWWSRILKKAGFKGKAYRRILWLITGPVAIGPLVALESHAVAEFILGFALLSFYIGLISIAVIPWPIRTLPQTTMPQTQAKKVT